MYFIATSLWEWSRMRRTADEKKDTLLVGSAERRIHIASPDFEYDLDDPPATDLLPQGVVEVATRDYESRLATWNQWQRSRVEPHGE
jgi:hypothetical protein